MRPLLHLMLGIKHHPLLFRAVWSQIRREGPSFIRRMVRPGDDAVIEGYPRSANTFATYAFLEVQGSHVRLGNHYHSPAQFVRARRYGVPAMLLLRKPLDAALSVVIYNRKIDAEEALIRYITFHRPLLPLADSFVIAPFEEVTTDFGRSIGRLNGRFGTAFAPFRHEEETQKQVFDRIQSDMARNAERNRDDSLNPLKAYIPTAEKKARSAEMKALFDKPSLDPLIRESERLYFALLERVESGPRSVTSA